MPRPWTLVSECDTAEGRLDLRRRGDDEYMIRIEGRVLMTSALHHTEVAVAELACREVATRKTPRVLIGGLGLGYTLRAALDVLPRDAEVCMAELTEAVVDWCRGPLRGLTNGAVDDPRVRVSVGDVTRRIREAPKASFDAIVLDLYEGPRDLPKGTPDPLYGARILEQTAAALRPGGLYAVWAEEPNARFERRLSAAGLSAELVRCGGRGPRHAVYLARKRERPAASGAGGKGGGKRRNASNGRQSGPSPSRRPPRRAS